MDVPEPHARHRGFFLHSDTGEGDHAEHDNPEGFAVRVRTARPSASRRTSGVAVVSGRSRTSSHIEDGRPAIRSGSVTGSRQRAHLPR